MDDTRDPFALLDVPRRFDLDLADLEQRYVRLSAEHHPDRFLDPLDQAEAAERAAAINDAYRTLKDPEARARALLSVMGGPANEDDKSLPADLLVEMMEAREELDAAIESGDAEAIERRRQWAQDRRSNQLAEIADHFTEAGDALSDACCQRIRTGLNALRYYQRMIEQMP